MAEAIVIPAALRDEIAADLEAGGERAARWRPAPPDHRFSPVLVLQGADRAGQDAIGHVGEVRGISTIGGYPNVTEVAVLMPGEWFADAAAWAPVGGVDSGPRPDIGDRILVLTDEGGDCPEPWIGHVTYASWGNLPIGAVMSGGVTPLAAQESAVTRWAILPPEVPAEIHALRADLDQALDVGAGLAQIIGSPARRVHDAEAIMTALEETERAAETSPDPKPLADAVKAETPSDDLDMYELAIRIPMSSFTGPPPNDDPRIDQVIDHAMDLFPAASATGGFAWPEDGPVQCPTCGAVNQAERRHRAHVDAETTLRELVRWLTTERDRLHTEHRRDATREPGPMIEARTLRIVLDRLRDQGLDVDYLAEPDTREQT